jgi:hypothetical protein
VRASVIHLATTFHADGGDGNDMNGDLLCQTTAVNPGKTLAVTARVTTQLLMQPPEPSVSMVEAGQRYEQQI